MNEDGSRSLATSDKHGAGEMADAVAQRLVSHSNDFFPLGCDDLVNVIGQAGRSAPIHPAADEGADRGENTPEDLADDPAEEDIDHAGMTKGTASRRAKTRQRRNHRVGPLRFNDDELQTVKLAADRAGLSLGAYVTDAVLRVADAELEGLPVEREHLQELRELQAALAGLQAGSNGPRHHGDPFDRLAKMLTVLLATIRRHERRLPTRTPSPPVVSSGGSTVTQVKLTATASHSRTTIRPSQVRLIGPLV